ncbi:hypothetical protein F4803DRAFT_550770 [Xylaria telfairii]|nr:hypothetical protein F4803DRAFT_550770 [Xylaria telfairii]
MNSNRFQIGGSPQSLVKTTSKFESDNQPHNYNVDDPDELFLPSSSNQLALVNPAHCSQELDVGPSYHPYGLASSAPNSSCRFRCEVLDDCAKARFYARALEFYLLEEENTNLSCPFADCAAQDFNNPKDMLRHLRRCPKFDKGVFRCPLCNCNESFRTRSSSRCCWNKEHLGEKIIRKIRDFTGNCLETQKPAYPALCRQCSAPLDKTLIGGASHATRFIESHPIQSTAPTIAQELMEQAIVPELMAGASGFTQVLERHTNIIQPITPTILPELMSLIPYELDPTPPPSELSAEYSPGALGARDLISEDSPVHIQPQPRYDNMYLGSGVSSETSSPDGNIMNPDISPRSFVPEETPPTTRRRNSRNTLKSIARRFTGFCSETGSSSCIENQRSTSLYANFPINHNIEPRVDLGTEASVGPINLPLSPTPHPSRPQLTIETPLTMLGFTAPPPGYEIPPYRSQATNYSATTEIQTAASLPTSLAHSQLSAMSVLDTLLPEEDIFMEQLFQNSSINPSPSASHYSMPNADQTSFSSSPSEQELKCTVCDFRPTGKPENHKGYLKKHMSNRHEKRDMIPCSHCNRSFTRIDNMRTHCRRGHGVSGGSKRGRGSSDSLPSTVRPKRRSSARS